MAQGYKGGIDFAELCQYLYEGFGQWAVINFIKDRQNEGYLSDVSWRDCLGCEERTPHYGDTLATELCLVCGGN